jgi:2-methylisocitrate lyase-like PEP mutase family enzyme
MTDAMLKAKAKVFHALHHGPDILILPNAWDGASAVLLAAAGFPAIATTSAGVAFCRGYPDGERISRAEMLAEVKRIVDLVEVPVTADLEAGYGPEPEDVAETVRQAIAAGAVGCNLEDGTGDRKAPLMELPRMIDRVRAARRVADAAGIEFVVNARTDVYLANAAEGAAAMRESVRRANAYHEAGARSLFVPAVNDRATLGTLAKEIAGPLNVLAGFATPQLAELKALGVARVSIGGSLARACYKLAAKAAEELRRAGTYSYAKESFSNPELNAMVVEARRRRGLNS